MTMVSSVEWDAIDKFPPLLFFKASDNVIYCFFPCFIPFNLKPTNNNISNIRRYHTNINFYQKAATTWVMEKNWLIDNNWMDIYIFLYLITDLLTEFRGKTATYSCFLVVIFNLQVHHKYGFHQWLLSVIKICRLVNNK